MSSRHLRLAYIESQIHLPPEDTIPGAQVVELTQPESNAHLYTVEAPLVRDWLAYIPKTDTLSGLMNWGVFHVESTRLGLAVVDLITNNPTQFPLPSMGYTCVGGIDNDSQENVMAYGLAMASSCENRTIRRYGFIQYVEGSPIEAWILENKDPGSIQAINTHSKNTLIGRPIGTVRQLFKPASNLIPLQKSLGKKSVSLSWNYYHGAEDKNKTSGSASQFSDISLMQFMPLPIENNTRRDFTLSLTPKLIIPQQYLNEPAQIMEMIKKNTTSSLAQYQFTLDKEPGMFVELSKYISECGVVRLNDWHNSLIYVAVKPIHLENPLLPRSHAPNDELPDLDYSNFLNTNNFFNAYLHAKDFWIMPKLFLNFLMRDNLWPREVLDKAEAGYWHSSEGFWEMFNTLGSGVPGTPPEIEFFNPPLIPKPVGTGQRIPVPKHLPAPKYQPPFVRHRPPNPRR